LDNKRKLADKLFMLTGVLIDPTSLYDIQVKRIHEYKRQHLSLLHIIALYNRVKKDPTKEIVSCTFIFGGKAAPGYYMAKDIIHLINAVADVVNNDLDVAGRIKVVFFPDYNVKNSEWVYRAADLSEQISLAGKEASGTGNMKFSLNGALTIGTLDGANVEIRKAVGEENFFLFGLKADEVAAAKAAGYSPHRYIESNEELKAVLNMIASGFFANGDTTVFKRIADELLGNDQYLLAADFASYMESQQAVSNAYSQPASWTKMSILNVARMGYFSSDRAIMEYCKKVWKVKPFAKPGKKV
jgi:starch phosphorylase